MERWQRRGAGGLRALAISAAILPLLLGAFIVLPGARPVAAHHCGGTHNVDQSNQEVQTIMAPAGQVIAGVSVKAGSGCTTFTTNTSDGCYSVSGLGTDTVTVERVGSGRDCKGISHLEASFGPGAPPPPCDPKKDPKCEPPKK